MICVVPRVIKLKNEMNGQCGTCGGRGEMNGWCLWGSVNIIKMGLQGIGLWGGGGR